MDISCIRSGLPTRVLTRYTTKHRLTVPLELGKLSSSFKWVRRHQTSFCFFYINCLIWSQCEYHHMISLQLIWQQSMLSLSQTNAANLKTYVTGGIQVANRIENAYMGWTMIQSPRTQNSEHRTQTLFIQPFWYIQSHINSNCFNYTVYNMG